MSQRADLEDTFRAFQAKYDWTDEETARNFREVTNYCLDWSVSYEEAQEIFNSGDENG